MVVAVVVLVVVKTAVVVVQWNPVNKVTNGSKKKMAILTWWPYYRDRLKFHDLRAVMSNTPYIVAFAFLEQVFSLIINRNEDISKSGRING